MKERVEEGLMSYASDITEIRRCRALLGNCVGPPGPPGPGVEPYYGSFQSNTTQSASTGNPIAITYSEKTIGPIDVVGSSYPNSQILISQRGTYKFLFSAQCDSSAGTHYLEIFPVINGTSVPDSNTRIRLGATIENCLTVEYILAFQAGDILELYMVGDSTNSRLLAITGNPATTPATPNAPSIIVTVTRIA